MKEWVYLLFGLPLFALLVEEKKRAPLPARLRFRVDLSLALALLLTLDLAFSVALWDRIEWEGFRKMNFLLWAFLFGRVREKVRKPGDEFLLIFLAISLWVSEQSSLSFWAAFSGGLALVWGGALIEGLLRALRDKVRLAQVPPALEGAPLLLWLAALLCLAFFPLAPNL